MLTESVLAYRRSRILIVVALTIAAIALLDWKIEKDFSFGFLYFFPIFLAASCLKQWQIAVVAAVCAVLRQLAGSFDHLFYSRLFLAWGSFTAAGWLVRGVLENFQKVQQQLLEIQTRDRLLRDSEEQMRVLIETSSAAILTLNKSRAVIQANEAACRLLGVEKNALLGHDIGEYMEALARVPSDPSAPVFRTTMECSARRPNGESVNVNVCFSSYVFAGEPRLTAVVTENEPAVSGMPEPHPGPAIVLTNLEDTVLRGIFEGQSNKEIAAGLEASESAVKSTIQRLFTKLGARTRSQLVRIAIERMGNQFPAPAAKAAAGDQKILSE